ncbi:hypothetical protein PR048_012442 [Dryococelus australis]|uniref:Uncharacterized protein n=1 Tax=Dryococelus australis TaxID=614101 RepID=A0ABQ9HPE7_9NEOP|nr:hypothetical protein PR048_012442 [Dryococelus australis]
MGQSRTLDESLLATPEAFLGEVYGKRLSELNTLPGQHKTLPTPEEVLELVNCKCYFCSKDSSSDAQSNQRRPELCKCRCIKECGAAHPEAVDNFDTVEPPFLNAILRHKATDFEVHVVIFVISGEELNKI